MLGSRRQARIIAIKALYELSYTEHTVERVMQRVVAEAGLSPEVSGFAKGLIQGVLWHTPQIDVVVRRFAPAFPVEQMAVIDNSILRLGIFEILFSDSTPDKVAIDEAVEMAKLFGSDASPRLINGVLGAVMSASGRNNVKGTKEE